MYLSAVSVLPVPGPLDRKLVVCLFSEGFYLLPMEKQSQPASFPTDQVSTFRSVDLVGDHCLDQFFHPVFDNQKVESICIPGDIFDEVNIKTDCIVKQISTYSLKRQRVL
jgi:hypothetical protein